MALINLHNHSTFSDGTLRPEELADAAAKAGIKYFSLTDHDAVGGWGEMAPALKARGINYCHGVEIGVSDFSYLHILGYGIDPADKELNARLTAWREAKTDRIKKVLALLAGQGINIAFEDMPWRGACPPNEYFLAKTLRDRGLVESRKQASELYFKPGRPAYVPESGPGVVEVIQTIKNAGGKAVLAHPYTMGKGLNLGKFKDAGLEGLEVFYPAHDEAATAKYLEQAKRYGLFVTAGIDFHGPGTDRDVMKGYEHSDERFAEVRKLFI